MHERAWWAWHCRSRTPGGACCISHAVVQVRSSFLLFLSFWCEPKCCHTPYTKIFVHVASVICSEFEYCVVSSQSFCLAVVVSEESLQGVPWSVEHLDTSLCIGIFNRKWTSTKFSILLQDEIFRSISGKGECNKWVRRRFKRLLVGVDILSGG